MFIHGVNNKLGKMNRYTLLNVLYKNMYNFVVFVSLLSIVYVVNLDCCVHNLDQTVLFSAICNNSILFHFAQVSEKDLSLSDSGSFAVNKACHY